MALEVYTATRPAVPSRAWLSSIFLLALVTGLAGWMSWTRSGESLAPRFAPPGWDIAFRPPMRFELLPPPATSTGNAMVYRTATASGDGVELVFRRIDAASYRDADEICNHIVRPHSSLLLAVLAPPPVRTIEKLGTMDAVQVLYPSVPMVVRAVRLQSGLGYSVSLRLDVGPIEEPLYRAFDLTCHSIELKPTP